MGHMGIVAAVFNLVVCFALPLGALVFYLLRYRRGAACFGLGVLSFFVSQVLLRLPILSALQQTAWYAVFAATQPLACITALALSAALFEEFARLVLMSPLRKRAYRISNAVAFGLGHGGLEAALVGINSAALLIAAPDQLSLAGPSVAFAGLERLGAIAFHVACSLLVYRALMCRKPGWFALALVLHTVCDMCAAFASSVPIWVYEFAFLTASVALLVLFARMFSTGPSERSIGEKRRGGDPENGSPIEIDKEA